MAFALKIAEGQEAGREFVFDQAAVTIGRTTECDIVLYDSGVSRQHARIFSDGSDYFIEDLGSSNGTRVNGSTIRKQRLSPGDSLALGGVVFSFSPQRKATPPVLEEVPKDGNSTRIVSEREIQRSRGARALVPKDASPEALQEAERKATRGLPAVSSFAAPARTIAKAISHISHVKALSSGSGRLSAAERARIRRESPGLLGTLWIFWLDASDNVRRAIVVGGVVVVLGLLGGLYAWLMSPGPRVGLPPEPKVLTRAPIKESFGLGEGVDYRNRDAKMFRFEFNASSRAVAIVHYVSADISEGEVDVSVNGASVGKLSPDVLGEERMRELVIPANFLPKRGEVYELVFDNTRNLPGRETWRIWNVWIDTHLIPEMPSEQLIREASEAFRRAERAYERKDIAAESRYQAWKGFREAWLKLEGHAEPKPGLFARAYAQMQEVQIELDRTCRKLLLEVEVAYQHRDYNGARAALDHVKDYFPANDQSCPLQAERKRQQYDLDFLN
ncbi:MAG: FHA domain-containing protein [Myxococcaceae bacterium]